MQKRRLQQAVELARRVLHLERAAARGRADVDAARTRVGELEEQVHAFLVHRFVNQIDYCAQSEQTLYF